MKVMMEIYLKSEANQERTEAVMEHSEGISRAEAMDAPSYCLQDQAADVLHGAPKVATYKETNGATEDQGVAVGYCVKLKTQTQYDSGLLQEVATAIGQLTHHAFPA
jgi:hypothetical protein